MIEQYGINAVPNGYLVQIGLHKFLDLMQVAVLRVRMIVIFVETSMY
jgi:hypothetical protein